MFLGFCSGGDGLHLELELELPPELPPPDAGFELDDVEEDLSFFAGDELELFHQASIMTTGYGLGVCCN